MKIQKGIKFKVNTIDKGGHLTKGKTYKIDMVYSGGMEFEFDCDYGSGHHGLVKHFNSGKYSIVIEKLNKNTKTL